MPTNYVSEEKNKNTMVIPVNPIFLYMNRGLPGSSLNGLVNVVLCGGAPWLKKERMKEEKEEKKVNRKEGRTYRK